MKKFDELNHPALAIVGIGCLFPKAGNVNEYWANIREGIDAITDIPDTHWTVADYFNEDSSAADMTYAKRGGFIDPVDFNPLLYGMSPNNIEATDTTQLLGMHVARAALLDAGYSTAKDTADGREFDRDKCSVIMGITGTLELVIPLGARLGHPIWRQALKDAGVDPQTAEDVVQRISEGYVPWQENSFPGLLGNVVAGRIANRFDLGGTNCVVDAACASSLSAVHMAAMELYAGRCDMAITGGMDTFNDIFMYMCFSKTPALSPTGNSRPFAKQGDGTILGEGLGAVILKRLDDATRDNDKIYAVIRGIGSSSDGRGNAVYAPSSSGQTKCLKDAYQEAAVSPRSIDLVEAHGTGTSVGDAVEATALSGVYGEQNNNETWCAVGSVKSMIGHTKAAAGAASLIKCAMALKHKVLPPTIKVDEPLEQLKPGTAPVYVNANKRLWVSSEDRPRRAAISAFGFGGSNFHCVLEEAEATNNKPEWDDRVLLFSFSADSVTGLKQQVSKINAENQWNDLRKLAAESRENFSFSDPWRLTFVLEKNKTEFNPVLEQVNAFIDADKSYAESPLGIWYSHESNKGKLGLLFPGQGSQYVGMMRDLSCQFPVFIDVLQQVNLDFDDSDRLSDVIYPISVFNNDARNQQEEHLRQTDKAQPAIGAMSIAGLKLLNEFGLKADAVAGHSYGELVALYAAGRMTEDELYRLSKLRGELIAAGEGDRGSMLAIIADKAKVEQLLTESKIELVIANHNAPNQIVVSGSTEQIEQCLRVCKEDKIRAAKLPVAAAFHSAFVAGAVQPFSEGLAELEFPAATIPVYANTAAAEYPQDSASARELLANQLVNPVRFVEQIEAMFAAGVRTFIELGPHNRLTGLIEAILADHENVSVLCLDKSAGKQHGVYDLACLLAQTATLGHVVNLKNWDEGYLNSLPDDADTKPAMTIKLSGANHVMPRNKKPPSTSKATLQQPTGQASSPAIELQQQTVTTSTPIANNELSNEEFIRATQQSILALQKMQEQTARLHQQYLQGQETAQQTIQQLLQQQQRLINGQPLVETPVVMKQEQTPVPVVNVKVNTDAVAQAVVPVPVQQERSDDEPKEIIETQHALSNKEVDNLLLEVVSEKTGYPLDMLSLEMSLDTDLGIDSIKRVEILSALQEKLPWAPVISPEELGTFQFLQHIVEFVCKAQPIVQTGTTVSRTVTSHVDSNKLSMTLLAVVAEKTGYPIDMLTLDMNLDSDLGIDSIKRVEILSALQESMPDMPAVSPDDLTRLQTLQEIVDFMQSEDKPAENSAPETTMVEVPINSNNNKLISRSIIKTVRINNERKRYELIKDATICIVDNGAELAKKLCQQLNNNKLQTKLIACDTSVLSGSNNIDGLIIFQNTESVPAQYLNLLQTAYAKLNNDALLVGITNMGGDFGLNGLSDDIDPRQAALTGLIKTADKEWDNINCKVIDIANDIDAEKLANEILCEGPLEVGLQATGAVAIVAEQQTTGSTGSAPAQKDDVVIITGGARGVTAEVAYQIAKQWQVELHLLGRSPIAEAEQSWSEDIEDEAQLKQALSKHNPELKPNELQQHYQSLLSQREVRRNLKRISSTDVKLEYHSIDVRDGKAMRSLVKKISKSSGPIKGIIHAAGVLADKLIIDKTETQFEQVFDTKVDGIMHLLASVDKDQLNFLVMFSSTTARLGRKGQCDYAAANEVLNKIAQQQSRINPACRVVSVNWGPWDGGMVTPALRKLFEAEGVGLIDLETGAKYLLDEIAQPGPTEVVILGGDNSSIMQNLLIDSSTDNEDFHIAFERVLSIDEYPFLQSHVMNGKAVLPVALMIEWFAHGAMHDNPGMQFHGIENFRMLKGISLSGDQHYDLQIMAGSVSKKGDAEVVPLELRSGKSLHATANVILKNEYETQPLANLTEISGNYPYPNNKIYAGGRLFHGKAMQGIEAITACSDAGIMAEVKASPKPAEWMQKPVRSSWLTDPLILDCCFQMMILWSHQQNGSGSLPTAIENYRQFTRAFPKQGIKIVVNVLEHNQHRARAAIEILDEQGEVIALMDGYECVRDASLNGAFLKNTIPESVK